MARRLATKEQRQLLDELVQVVADAWESGSSVVSYCHEFQEQTARVALRRWRSFDRRNKTNSPDRARMVEDLAKGLRDHDWDDIRMVGSLIEDYGWVASQLAKVLEKYDL